MPGKVRSHLALADNTLVAIGTDGNVFAFKDNYVPLPSVDENNNWLQWMHYGNRTGKTNGTGPVNPVQLWNNSLAANPGIRSPLISGEYVIMISDTNVSAFNLTTGTLLWNNTMENNQFNNFAAIANGRVFLTNSTVLDHGRIFSINLTNGQILWTYSTSLQWGITLPLLTDSSSVYVFSSTETGFRQLISLSQTDG